jgi:hypothetical protein
MLREGTKKIATAENIAVRMENKVEVSDSQPSAFENVSDDRQNDVDALRAAPILRTPVCAGDTSAVGAQDIDRFAPSLRLCFTHTHAVRI